jgi:hypothetical protein
MMKKLKLNVEELDVVQFQVGDDKRDAKGTVYGNGPSYWYSGCVVCPNIHYTYSCGC